MSSCLGFSLRGMHAFERKGILGAREERKEREKKACKDAFVFFVFHIH